MSVAAIPSSSLCSLCRCSLANAVGKGRHKKLNGKRCLLERETLRKCAEDFNCVTQMEAVLQKDDAMICYSCIGNITKLNKFETQVQQLREKIASAMINLPVSSTSISAAQITGTPQRPKRIKSQCHSSKRIRTSVSANKINELDIKNVLLQISINHDDYTKVYNITPAREDAAAKLARRNYPSFAKTVVDNFTAVTTKAFASTIKQEIQAISSANCNLRSDDVLNFSWDDIWSQYQQYLPQFTMLLDEIIPDSGGRKHVICLIMSIILKFKHAKISLVQKIISLYLYGNSVHKKVNSRTY